MRSVAAALCLLIHAPALAQIELIAPVPAFEGVDAELMVQVNDLAAHLRTPQGRSLRRMTDEMGVFNRTSEAWNGLSRALKMSPDEAIDRLLGGRVLLIADGVGGAGMRWACVMEVDNKIARLVPKRLKAAPRDTMNGRTVYAVEDGRFRVVHMPASVDASGKPGVATIAIAHAGAGGDSMLAAGAELGSRWTRRETLNAGGVLALMLYRAPTGSRLLGTLHGADGGWRLRFNASPGLFGALASGTPTVSRRWFDAMSDESMLAFAGPVSRGPVSRGAGPEVGPAGWFDLGPEGVIWRLLPFDPPGAFVSSGSRLASLSIDAAGRGRLDCTLGFLVDDAERAVKLGDEYVCDILEDFTGSPGYGETAPLCVGTYPGAARLQTVALDEHNERRDAYGPNLSFVWGVRADADERGAGWWTMRVLSENVPDATATLMRHQTPIDTRGGERAAMMGRVRPAELLAATSVGAGMTGVTAGPLLSLRWIDEVFWRIDDPGRGGGMLSGELVLRMRSEP